MIKDINKNYYSFKAFCGETNDDLLRIFVDNNEYVSGKTSETQHKIAELSMALFNRKPLAYITNDGVTWNKLVHADNLDDAKMAIIVPQFEDPIKGDDCYYDFGRLFHDVLKAGISMCDVTPTTPLACRPLIREHFLLRDRMIALPKVMYERYKSILNSKKK